MKVILDIPDEEIEIIKRNGFNKDGTFSFKLNDVVKQAMRNGVVIPDNATNGDVFMLMHPYMKLENASLADDNLMFIYVTYKEKDCRWKAKNGQIMFNRDWWNAPYKGGQKND